MVKNVFLLFIASLMTIVMSPKILSATDDVDLTGVSDAKAVETVIAEPEPVVAKAPVAGYAPAAPVAMAATPANNIQIAGRTIEIVGVGSTTVDAGNHVNKYGSLLYGHNSAGVFGGILNMGVGSTFTVTYGGVTTTYRVANAVMFEKNLDSLQSGNPCGYSSVLNEYRFLNDSVNVEVEAKVLSSRNYDYGVS